MATAPRRRRRPRAGQRRRRRSGDRGAGNQHSDLKLRAQSSQRTVTTRSDQQSVVSDIKANGGTDITRLVSVNAVAAQVSAAEVERLRANPAVREIVPDEPMTVDTPAQAPHAAAARLSSRLCPTDPAKPLLEPEALAVTRTETDRAGDDEQASKIATGKGVIVAIDGMNELAGNPDFVRPDGSHVVIDAPDPVVRRRSRPCRTATPWARPLTPE